MTPNLEIFGLYSNSAIKIMAFNLEIPCPPLRSNRNVYARVKNYFDIRQNPPEYQRRTLGAVQKMMSTAEGEIINSKEKEKKVEKREITERKNTF